MERNKRLTKVMLENMGISDVYWNEESKEWEIYRCTFREKNDVITSMSMHKLKIHENTTKRKYTQPKRYPIVAFSYKNKTRTYPLSRFLYVWFIGDIDDGQEVDHIDNDTFNNSLDNLQLLSTRENLIKRYSDNPDAPRNQYEAMRLEFREEPEPKTTFVDFAAFGDD